eukprot:5312845-Prymnesium_polylepis.1
MAALPHPHPPAGAAPRAPHSPSQRAAGRRASDTCTRAGGACSTGRAQPRWPPTRAAPEVATARQDGTRPPRTGRARRRGAWPRPRQRSRARWAGA